MDEIDISTMSDEEKDKRVKYQIAATALNQAGFRSVIYGYGYFLDVEKCKNPYYLDHIIKRGDKKAETYRLIAEYLRTKGASLCDDPDAVQSVYQFDENGTPIGITTDPTVNDLLKALEREAI